MSLSEHELRVLQEIEQELARVPSSRLHRIGRFVLDRRTMILTAAAAVAAVAVLALFAVAWLAAPLAAACGATAGYVVRARRYRTARRRRKPH